jgi:hypothetical protein
MRAPTNNARVELAFAPTMPLVTVVRTFINDFYARVLRDGASDMVAMATHELLENALKYSVEDGATLMIDVEPGAAADRVTIRIRNRSAPAYIGPLKDVIERMQSHPDPVVLYLTLMRETARRKEGSGLGLARLRAEAGMSLALELEGNDVCVIAHCDVDKREAA